MRGRRELLQNAPLALAFLTINARGGIPESTRRLRVLRRSLIRCQLARIEAEGDRDSGLGDFGIPGPPQMEDSGIRVIKIESPTESFDRVFKVPRDMHPESGSLALPKCQSLPYVIR